MALQSSDRLSRRRDYATTFFAEGTFIVSYLLVFRLVADHFGPPGFGQYALARRTLAFLLPLGAIGLDIAIARYVAYSAGRREQQLAYLPAALGMLAVALAVQSALLLLFQEFWAEFFFGAKGYAALVPPLALMVAGNGVFAVAYGNFRGHLQIFRANVLRVIVHGIAPVVAALAIRGSVAGLLYGIGGAWLVLSLGSLAFTRMRFDAPVARATDLARYSLPRVPGDLLALLMFAVPGIVVAHVSDIAVAGDVAFGVAAIGMFAVAAYPVGFVLLPVASRLIAAGSVEQLRVQVFGVARVIVALIVFGIAVFEVFATPIVTIYLGPAFSGTVATLRILMLGALPWALYISLRSIIDARHTRAVNAINIAISFAVFLTAMLVLRTWFDPAIVVVPTFVVSLYVLGALTILEVWRITRRPGDVTLITEREEAAEPVL